MKRYLVLAVALCATPSLVPVAHAQPPAPVKAKRTIVVSIAGHVLKPGVCRVQQGDTLLSLLALVGGVDQNANSLKVELHREGTDSTYELASLMLPQGEGMLPQGEGAKFLLLQDGDIINLVSAGQVAITGDVPKPGYYAIPQGKTFSVGEALALAGVVRTKGDLLRVRILRKTPEGKLELLSVEEETLLQPDDLIFLKGLGKPGRPDPN